MLEVWVPLNSNSWWTFHVLWQKSYNVRLRLLRMANVYETYLWTSGSFIWKWWKWKTNNIKWYNWLFTVTQGFSPFTCNAQRLLIRLHNVSIFIVRTWRIRLIFRNCNKNYLHDSASIWVRLIHLHATSCRQRVGDLYPPWHRDCLAFSH